MDVFNKVVVLKEGIKKPVIVTDLFILVDTAVDYFNERKKKVR